MQILLRALDQCLQVSDEYLLTAIPSWVLLPIGVLLVGLAANCCVQRAVTVAEHFKWPSFFIGVVIALSVTSLFELFRNCNYPSTVIASAGLAWGIAAIISPISFIKRIIKEHPFIFIGLATVEIGVLIYPNFITATSGVGLLIIFSVYLHREFKKRFEGNQEEHKINFWKVLAACLNCIIFLNLICYSAHMIAVSGINVAFYFSSVSEIGEPLFTICFILLVLPLVLAAICHTILPALAISIIAAKKGHRKFALGTIIGGSIFYVIYLVYGHFVL